MYGYVSNGVLMCDENKMRGQQNMVEKVFRTTYVVRMHEGGARADQCHYTLNSLIFTNTKVWFKRCRYEGAFSCT